MQIINEEPKLKRCSKCGKFKPLSDYYKDPRRKCGVYSSCKFCIKQWREQNRDRINKKKMIYRENNKESINEYMAEYNKKNKEKISEYKKQYYIKNKYWLAKDNRKRAQTPEGKLSKKNSESRRRQRINKTPKEDQPTISQWKNILKSQNYRCALCGCKFDEDTIPTMDHIVPLSRGGEHTSANIHALCASCNSGKRDRINYNYIQSWICIV